MPRRGLRSKCYWPLSREPAKKKNPVEEKLLEFVTILVGRGIVWLGLSMCFCEFVWELRLLAPKQCSGRKLMWLGKGIQLPFRSCPSSLGYIQAFCFDLSCSGKDIYGRRDERFWKRTKEVESTRQDCTVTAPRRHPGARFINFLSVGNIEKLRQTTWYRGSSTCRMNHTLRQIFD